MVPVEKQDNITQKAGFKSIVPEVFLQWGVRGGGGLKSTLRPALMMKVKILIFIRPRSSLVTTAQLISPANQQSPCPSPCHCQVLQDYFCSSLFCSFILLSFFNLLLLHFRPHSLWKSLVCIFFSALSESGSTKFRSHSPQLSSSLL